MTRRDWLLFLALMVVVTIIALPILTYPPGRDQGEFATIARGLLDGRVPYVDLWNPKPPAVFYVYALGDPGLWADDRRPAHAGLTDRAGHQRGAVLAGLPRQ